MCWWAKFAPFFLILLLCSVFALVFSQDTCPVVRYTGKFNESDHVKDHALTGRSYKNLTTNTVQECFSVCINDCRCVSYQLSGRRCELIDEDRHTAPDLFKRLPGYKYYELKQQLRKSNSVSCSSQCNNGCCRYSKPCLNGGTCIETCQNVTHKFQCKCAQGFGGRVCQIPPSCAAYVQAHVCAKYLSNPNNQW
ncbi:notch homolog 2 N-terminal-like protein B isoform X1 [Actinia tenebrosa]|uniref:Notch homolog 2 N-terminal-like protein B isoform X1 n=1 Tax=Actinia tenebrosa TaxID=6105 RepID=A0A6P8J4Q8_ACTTE|nr:notch homolog 2 N-terminal-like protein B isoform X1 [Actinia tenebrosa]